MRNQNFCPLSHNSPASYAKRLCVPAGKFYIRNTIHPIKSFDKIHLLPIKSDKNITSVSSCDKEIHFARKLIKYHVLLVNKKPPAKRPVPGVFFFFFFFFFPKNFFFFMEKKTPRGKAFGGGLFIRILLSLVPNFQRRTTSRNRAKAPPRLSI